MAGFTSIDDLINQVSTSAKFWRADWNKNQPAVATAGEWNAMMRGGGNPAADTLFDTPATALLFQSCYDISTFPGVSGGIQHGGNVGVNGDGYKVILNASAYSAAATTMPAVLMLVDLLAFHYVTATATITAQNTILSTTFTASDGAPGILLTYAAGTDFTPYQKVRFTNAGGALPTGLSAGVDYWLIRVGTTSAKVASTYANAIAGTAIAFSGAGSGTNTVTCRLPRYSDGAGVQTFFYNPHSTALGAGTPNLTLGYTNSAGTASRATPSSPASPIAKTAATNGLILYSGTGSGKYGPFVPLQAGDAGVQSIQTIRNDATMTSGQYTVVYCRPLLTLPMTTIGVAAERDLVNQLPSMPRVYDGACLNWLLYSGAATPANSAFYGHIDFGWS